MALQVDFELDEQIYRDCYLRIHKINTQQIDYEYFKKVDEPDRPEISERLAWEIRLETSAVVYVYADRDVRENRARALKWFSFKFDYDLKSPDNIYRQAYKALKSHEDFEDAKDV